MTGGGPSVERLLATGDIEVEGRLWDSSNAAMRVICSAGEDTVSAVYKPMRGERPLWDFPSGTLGRREVATSVLDRALGWGLVPVTVWRDEAPLGPGSLQAWVDIDPERPPVDVVEARAIPTGWHVVAEGEGARGDHVCLVHEDSSDLRRLALLDALANNADRKGGHVLRSRTGCLAGIDHGLTFHPEPKLRTVLWGWSGTEIEATHVADLRSLAQGWRHTASELAAHLSRAEVVATRERLDHLLRSSSYPGPDGAWPALPWPAM